MGRITDALRKLGTKLTGKPTVESNNIATVLSDIANDYENTNLTVHKTDTDLYNTLNKALTLGKPILWYEDETTCYYIDTISKSGTDIILAKGGKKIIIEADNDITEVGNIQPTTPVQSDWSQNDNTKLDYIKNKPTIPSQTKVYKHIINASGDAFEIINTDSEQMNTTKVTNYLYNLPTNQSLIGLVGEGPGSHTFPIFSYKDNMSFYKKLYVINDSNGAITVNATATVSSFTDTVVEL